MSDLLPCPFCGGEAVNDTHSKRTGCPKCGIWVHRTGFSTEDGITRCVERETSAWNTRHSDLADAWIAAALSYVGDRINNTDYGMNYHAPLTKYIRAFTPAEARNALDAMLKAEREKALREAAEQIAPDPDLADTETSAKCMRRACSSEILALISEDKTDE